MPKVTLINPDNTRTELEVAVGDSVMRAATAAGLDGIVGDCGGGLSCSTCHVVIVDDAYFTKAPEISPTEDQMLDFTAMEREPNSRLSCQLVMTDEMDGLVVRVADPQL